MLFHDSRRGTRTGPEGELILLADQDRSRWDRREIEEGVRVLNGALRRPPSRPLPGRGGDRRAARLRPVRRRDRLAPDRGPVRAAPGVRALARGRLEPGGGGGGGGPSRGWARAASTGSTDSSATTCCMPSGPISCAGSTARGGERRVPARARADAQSRPSRSSSPGGSTSWRRARPAHRPRLRAHGTRASTQPPTSPMTSTSPRAPSSTMARGSAPDR